MKKLKTRRAAAKRFTKTASGAFKAHKGSHSHLLSSKNRKRKRTLKKLHLIKAGSIYQNLSRLMPYN